MSEPQHLFPQQIILNGADYFLLQLDQIMLRSSGRQNVCTFVVALQERLELEVLEQSLSANPAYQWITGLRLRKGTPFSLVKWKFDANATLPKIKQYQLSEQQDLADSLLATKLKIAHQTPFKVALVQVSGAGSLLVFTWHHTLMDAHGGESFIQYLGAQKQLHPPLFIQNQEIDLPLKQRAEIAQEMRQFLYNRSQLPLISLYTKKSTNPTIRYRVLSFSVEQSHSISENARQQGAGFLLSAFYLTATACAVAKIQQQRGPLEGDVLIPVPLDRRKRGVLGPVIGNQVTFLFYRIPKQALSNVQGCTLELIEQMKSLMRSDNPKHYLIMMDFLRRVPGLLYRLLLKSPTEGLMASFFYSDTGDSLPQCDQLFGQLIESAVHYPPTMYPPGLTFVFSRFRGSLQLTFGYIEQVINEQEVEQLLLQIQSTLLGKGTE